MPPAQPDDRGGGAGPQRRTQSTDPRSRLKDLAPAELSTCEQLDRDRIRRGPRGLHQIARERGPRSKNSRLSLTDRSHTLASACGAFGVPYEKRDVTHGVINEEDLCREDVEATTRLCQANTREFLRHPVNLQATKAYSPATIGKRYLRKVRVSPAARPAARPTRRFLAGRCPPTTGVEPSVGSAAPRSRSSTANRGAETRGELPTAAYRFMIG